MPCTPSAALVAAFLGVLTAATGTWIAWQQHKATRSKLRLDLYDRRYAVFTAVVELLSRIVSKGTCEAAEILAFDREAAQTSFLFDVDVVSFIDSIRDRAIAFRANSQRLAALATFETSDRDAIVERDSEHLKWFVEQVSTCRSVFHKYLSFTGAL